MRGAVSLIPKPLLPLLQEKGLGWGNPLPPLNRSVSVLLSPRMTGVLPYPSPPFNAAASICCPIGMAARLPLPPRSTVTPTASIRASSPAKPMYQP